MRTSLPIALLLLCAAQLPAQIPTGGTPPSLQTINRALFSDLSTKRQLLPELDLQKVLAEDAAGPDVRFAAPLNVDYSPAQSGEWTELPNGDRIWRLYVQGREAKALIAFYEEVYLPPGAELYMYRPDAQQMLGPYTGVDAAPGSRLMTGLLYGDEAVIEYFEPAAVAGQGRFRIHRIDYAYKEVGRSSSPGGRGPAFGFGASLDCQIGSDCPLGDPVDELKRGVCRIIVVVEEGTGYCTGNLVNNTAEDGKPFIYTGFHCMDGYTPIYAMWRFDFQYRVVGCADPVAEPQFFSRTGSTFRAGRRENDFLLLELNDAIPANVSPYYLGWNRQAAPPDTAYMLHHPRGDVQKVSRSTVLGTIFNGPIFWNNNVTTPRNHHFNLDLTEGNYEVGSSGAALINTNGQLVGHLNGGNPDTAACNFSQAWFGRFSLAWDGGGTPDTRLKDWLDPLNSNAMEMGGFSEASPQIVSGTILSYFDKDPIPGVTVTLSLDGNPIQVTSGADGVFTFLNVGAADNYTLSFSKNTSLSNGVSGIDILTIQRHILGLTPLLGPYRRLAADVDASGSISALDVISMRRVILAVATSFSPNTESWMFLPESYVFPDPDKPRSPAPPQTISSGNLADLQNLEITAIKLGDVDDSANGAK